MRPRLSSAPPTLLEEWSHGAASDLARECDERRRRGEGLTDLITANPQDEGFEFSATLLDECLAEGLRASRVYRPDASGRREAREAVARFHGGIGADQVLLTPGTSLAYWAVFRLLAGQGTEILCPSPTYPLFDDLAKLAGIGVRRYHLAERDGKWSVDPAEVEFQVTLRTRAIAIVSPHNPTGSVASKEELEAVCAIARHHGLAVIFDEVFREFVHTGAKVWRPSECGAPLAVTLNGFSKMFALPGLKAGWMVVEGDAPLCRPFLDAAAYLWDTLLPVCDTVQAAMPRLMDEGMGEAARFAALMRDRMEEMVKTCRAAAVQTNHPAAGPYLILEVPDLSSHAAEEEFAVRLLRKRGILLHPGGFYDLPPGHLVATCIRRPPYPMEPVSEELRQPRP